jgi:3-methylcrotonyl-CoA carboxylase alpha subunit
MKARFDIDGVAHEVLPVRRPDAMELRIADRVRMAALRQLGGGEAVVTLDGRPQRVWIAQQGDEIHVHAAGRAWRIQAIDDVDAAHGHGSADDALIAPMPGTIVAVNVEPGAAVKRGEVILVIESMKLETSLGAPRDGIVQSVALGKGATFDKGATLATLVPQSENG